MIVTYDRHIAKAREAGGSKLLLEQHPSSYPILLTMCPRGDSIAGAWVQEPKGAFIRVSQIGPGGVEQMDDMDTHIDHHEKVELEEAFSQTRMADKLKQTNREDEWASMTRLPGLRKPSRLMHGSCVPQSTHESSFLTSPPGILLGPPPGLTGGIGVSQSTRKLPCEGAVSIMVRNLPRGISKEQLLRELMVERGQLDLRNRYAFVSFVSVRHAERFLNMLDGFQFPGKHHKPLKLSVSHRS